VIFPGLCTGYAAGLVVSILGVFNLFAGGELLFQFGELFSHRVERKFVKFAVLRMVSMDYVVIV